MPEKIGNSNNLKKNIDNNKINILFIQDNLFNDLTIIIYRFSISKMKKAFSLRPLKDVQFY